MSDRKIKYSDLVGRIKSNAVAYEGVDDVYLVKAFLEKNPNMVEKIDFEGNVIPEKYDVVTMANIIRQKVGTDNGMTSEALVKKFLEKNPAFKDKVDLKKKGAYDFIGTMQGIVGEDSSTPKPELAPQPSQTTTQTPASPVSQPSAPASGPAPELDESKISSIQADIDRLTKHKSEIEKRGRWDTPPSEDAFTESKLVFKDDFDKQSYDGITAQISELKNQKFKAEIMLNRQKMDNKYAPFYEQYKEFINEKPQDGDQQREELLKQKAALHGKAKSYIGHPSRGLARTPIFDDKEVEKKYKEVDAKIKQLDKTLGNKPVDSYLQTTELDPDSRQELRHYIARREEEAQVTQQANELFKQKFPDVPLPQEALEQFSNEVNQLSADAERLQMALKEKATLSERQFEAATKELDAQIQSELLQKKAQLEQMYASGQITVDDANKQFEELQKAKTVAYNEHIRGYNENVIKAINSAHNELINTFNQKLEGLHQKYGVTKDGQLSKDVAAKYQSVFAEIFAEKQKASLEKWNSMSRAEQMGTAFGAGVHDMFGAIGGGLQWMGAYEAGNILTDKAKEYYKEADIPVFDFSDTGLWSADWWIANGVRTIPFTLALMAPGMGTSFAISSALAKTALSTTAKTIATGVGGAVAVRPLEGFMEAGGAFNESIQSGQSVETASETASEIMGKNMYLVANDAVQLGMAFLPVKGFAAKSLLFAFEAGTEGAEELFQEYFNYNASAKRDIENPVMSLMEFAKTDAGITSMVLGAATGTLFQGGAEGMKYIAGMKQKSVQKQAEDFIAYKVLASLFDKEGDVEKRRGDALNTLEVFNQRGLVNEKKLGEFKAIVDFMADLELTAPGFDAETKAVILQEYAYVASKEELMKNVKSPEARKALEAKIKELKTKLTGMISGKQPIYTLNGVLVTKEKIEAEINKDKFMDLFIAGKINMRAINDDSGLQEKVVEKAEAYMKKKEADEKASADGKSQQDQVKADADDAKIQQKQPEAKPVTPTANPSTKKGTELTDKAKSFVESETEILTNRRGENPKESSFAGKLIDKFVEKVTDRDMSSPSESLELLKSDPIKYIDKKISNVKRKIRNVKIENRKEYEDELKELEDLRANFYKEIPTQPVGEQPTASGKGEEKQSPPQAGSQPEAKPVTDIEAKKADIEKRRQDELETLDLLHKSDVHEAGIMVDPDTPNDSQSPLWKVGVSKFSKNVGDKGGMLYSEALSQGGFKTRQEAEEYLKDIETQLGIKDQINAKYDAKLAALESKQQPVSEQPTASGKGEEKQSPSQAGSQPEAVPVPETKPEIKNETPTPEANKPTSKDKAEADKKPEGGVPAGADGVGQAGAKGADAVLKESKPAPTESDIIKGSVLKRLNKSFLKAGSVILENSQQMWDKVKELTGVRFSVNGTPQRSAAGFYSTVEDALIKLPQGKGTPEQMKAMLLKNGAKQAEMDWMGFDEHFFNQKSVTKAEIQEWIDQNRIDVQEVVFGATEWKEVKKGQWERKIDRGTPTGRTVNVGKIVINEVDGKFYATPSTTKYTQVFNTLEEAKGHYDQITRLSGDARNTEWQLKGGVNSREIVLTMPGQIESFAEGDRTHYGDVGGGTAVAWVRVNDRTSPDGKRILFVEEIQSKRGQEGKKKGFKGDFKNKSLVEPRFDGKYWYLHEKETGEMTSSQSFSSEAEAWRSLEQTYNLVSNAVPAMPFQKTDQWVNLALRRLMMYAVDGGYDAIAWTTGDQQAERYDLSKQLDRISYEVDKKTKKGSFPMKVRAYPKDGNYPMVKEVSNESELSDFIGKDTAQKIINNEGGYTEVGVRVIKEEGLKVSSPGMKAFYDNIIPTQASKLGKPFGSKLTQVKIDLKPEITDSGIDTETGDYPVSTEGKYATVQAMPVTETMRETMRQKGAPLFHYTESGEILGFTHEGKIYLNGEKLNANTTMEEAGHLWINWARQKRPDLYKAGIEKVRGSRYIKQVEASDFYRREALKQGKQGSRGYNDYIESEALSKAIADNGAKFVTETRKEGFKEWVRSMWKAVIEYFGIQKATPRQISKMTLEEFATRAAADMFSGKAEPIKQKVNRKGQKARNLSNERKMALRLEVIDTYDLALQWFIAGGTINTEAIQSVLGGKRGGVRKSIAEEIRSRISYNRKDGLSIGAAAEAVLNDAPEGAEQDDYYYRDAIEDIILRFNSPEAMAKYLNSKYMASAEDQERADNFGYTNAEAEELAELERQEIEGEKKAVEEAERLYYETLLKTGKIPTQNEIDLLFLPKEFQNENIKRTSEEGLPPVDRGENEGKGNQPDRGSVSDKPVSEKATRTSESQQREIDKVRKQTQQRLAEIAEQRQAVVKNKSNARARVDERVGLFGDAKADAEKMLFDEGFDPNKENIQKVLQKYDDQIAELDKQKEKALREERNAIDLIERQTDMFDGVDAEPASKPFTGAENDNYLVLSEFGDNGREGVVPIDIAIKSQLTGESVKPSGLIGVNVWVDVDGNIKYVGNSPESRDGIKASTLGFFWDKKVGTYSFSEKSSAFANSFAKEKILSLKALEGLLSSKSFPLKDNVEPAPKPAPKEPWQMTKNDFAYSPLRFHNKPTQDGKGVFKVKENADGTWDAWTESLSGTEYWGRNISSVSALDGGIRKVAYMDSKIKGETLSAHRDAVQQALSEGKPVPAEVLADYPELAPKPVTSYSDKTRYGDTAIKVGERYYDSRYGDYYTIESITPFGADDVDVSMKYDKGKVRTEKGSFILYHINEKQHSLDVSGKQSASKPAPKEPWQMKRSEYVENMLNAANSTDPTVRDDVRWKAYKDHEKSVRDAVSKGESVNPLVLEDYADLYNAYIKNYTNPSVELPHPFLKMVDVMVNTGKSPSDVVRLIARLAGDANKDIRQQVMTVLKGEKVPIAKSGITALEQEVFKWIEKNYAGSNVKAKFEPILPSNQVNEPSPTYDGLSISQTSDGTKYMSDPAAVYPDIDEEYLGTTIQAVWEEKRDLQFTGTTRVKDASDVAEIMKLLEDASVEHAFAVHVDAEGNSHIQFLSIGGVTGTAVDPKLIAAGVEKFGSKKVYLVHNHPSGYVEPSDTDYILTKKVRTLLKGINVEHVIMDTYKMEYYVLDDEGEYKATREKKEGVQDLGYHTMSKFKLLGTPIAKIEGSSDAVHFVQQFRFSGFQKLGMLVLNNKNEIIANYPLPDPTDILGMIKLIGKTPTGVSVIFYGNTRDFRGLNKEISRFRHGDIRVLDYIVVDSNGEGVNGYYRSMADASLLNETQASYGTNMVNDPGEPDPAALPESKVKKDPNPRQKATVKDWIDEDKLTNENLKGIEFPELVELAKELAGKEVIVRILAKTKLGRMEYNSKSANVVLSREFFKTATVEELAQVLGHEIGHLIDWLSNHTTKDNNLLGRIAGLKGYHKTLLPEMPGKDNILTDKDRARLRYEAEKELKAEFNEGIIEIIEEVTREVPIYQESQLTPKDILDIWNNANEDIRSKNPDLYLFVAALNAQAKKELIKKAMQGIVEESLQKKFGKILSYQTITEQIKRTITPKPVTKESVRERFKQLLKEEVNKRRLFEQEVIKDELKKLTKWWRPFNEKSNAKYTDYRYSDVELYADALSVLFNAPQELAERAPHFNRAFFNYFSQKPEAKEAYERWQEILSDPERVMIERSQRTRKGYSDAREKIKNTPKAQRRFGWADSFMMKYVSTVAPLIKKISNASQDKGLSDRQKVRNLIERLRMVDNKHVLLLEKVRKEIVIPLTSLGVDMDTFGEILQYERVMSEPRADKANPGGMQPVFSDKQIRMIKLKYPPEVIKVLEDKVKQFHEIVFDVIVDAHERGGLYIQEQMEYFLKNKYTYATFQTVTHATNYISATIKPIKGTLDAIRNPLESTIAKMFAIQTAADKSEAAGTLVDFLSQVDEVLPAKREKGKGEFIEKRDKYVLTYYENGKLKGVYVDPYFKEVFNQFTPNDVRSVTTILRMFNNVFKPMVTTYNPGFALLVNAIRDSRRTVTNLTAVMGAGKPFPIKDWASVRARMLLGFIPAIKEGRKLFNHDITPLLEEMIEAGVLDVRTGISVAYTDQQSESVDILAMRVHPHLYNPNANKWWKKNMVFGAMRTLGRVYMSYASALEAGTKINAYKYLKDHGFDKDAAAFYTRNYTGTPNYKEGGLSTPKTNQWLPFSNVIIQGLRADSDLAFNKKTAGAYWFDILMGVALPAAFTALLAAGMLGRKYKELYDKISNYDKYNYMCIPIGETEDGNVRYLRIPMDEVSRFVWAMTYASVRVTADERPLSDKELNHILDVGTSFYPGLSPMVNVVDGWAGYVFNGQSPVSYTGAQVIPPQTLKTGRSWESTKPMLTWTLNSVGGSGIMSLFAYDPLQNSTTEWTVKNIPVASRIYKESNVGEAERYRAIFSEVDKETSRRNLKETKYLEDVAKDYIKDVYNPDEKPKDQAGKQFEYLNKKVVEYIGEFKTIEDQEAYNRMMEKGKHIIIGGVNGKFQNVIMAVIDFNSVKAKAKILNEFRTIHGDEDFAQLRDYLDYHRLLSKRDYQEWYKQNGNK